MNSAAKYKILFTNSILGGQTFSGLEPRTIVISIQSEKWNDFGHNIRFDMMVKNRYLEVYPSKIFLAFKKVKLDEIVDEGNEQREVDSTNSQSRREIQVVNSMEVRDHLVGLTNESTFTELKNFEIAFSMLPSLKSYRELVKYHGVSEANLILKSLSDLVRAKEFSPNSKLPEKARATDVFATAFMRNSESFFAYYSAGSILRGLERESFSKISQNLKLNYKLAMFENRHEIDLMFEHSSVIPRRVNVIIGKNGLGKSMALRGIANSLLKMKGSIDAKLIDEKSENETKRPLINRLLVLGTPGETDNTFPNPKSKDLRIEYKRISISRTKGKLVEGPGETLAFLLRDDEELKGRTRFEIFYDSAKEFLPLNNIYFELGNGFSEEIPALMSINDFLKPMNEQKKLRVNSMLRENTNPQHKIAGKLYPLSSGQLSYLKLSLICARYIENGSLVLLDEPETHLHPDFISGYIDLLDTVLEKTGSFAVVATHSPYVVREVPKDQVHVLSQVGNRIEVLKPRIPTIGADIGDISYFAFSNSYDARLASKIYTKIKRNKSNLRPEDFKNELSSSLIMSLKEKLTNNEKA
jgi:predicted ATPase